MFEAGGFMIDLNDIHSLTDFQRRAKEYLSRLKKSGRPVVLTINGKAEFVVQDAVSYQRMLDLIDRAEAIEGIRRGLEEVEQGKTRPAKQVFAKMRKKHRISEE